MGARDPAKRIGLEGRIGGVDNQLGMLEYELLLYGDAPSNLDWVRRSYGWQSYLFHDGFHQLVSFLSFLRVCADHYYLFTRSLACALFPPPPGHSSSFYSCASTPILNRSTKSLAPNAIMSTDLAPSGSHLYADQRGRIIGTCAAVIALTSIFVFLRLLSRKLSRAGFWVRLWILIHLPDLHVRA